MQNSKTDFKPITYLFFAFIAMAGMSYINFLPGVVDALAGDIGFDAIAAGEVVALNGYGALLGSIIAIFLVRYFKWKTMMYMTLVPLSVIDSGTFLIKDYEGMLIWRFMAGCLGGIALGVAFSVLARLRNPDKAFGFLLFMQFTIGALVISLLPYLEEVVSAYAVFYIMAVINIFSVMVLLFLPSTLPSGATHKDLPDSPTQTINIWLLMMAIGVFLTGASAMYAYVGQIGLSASLPHNAVSQYIALTGLLGLAGALLPVINGQRFGRLFWLLLGVVLCSVSSWLLNQEALSASVYILSLSLLFFAWPAVQTYLFAVAAQFDDSGRLSTVSSVVASLGMATGPMMAASLIEVGGHSMLLKASGLMFLLSFVLLFCPVRVKEVKANVSIRKQQYS